MIQPFNKQTLMTEMHSGWTAGRKVVRVNLIFIYTRPKMIRRVTYNHSFKGYDVK